MLKSIAFGISVVMIATLFQGCVNSDRDGKAANVTGRDAQLHVLLKPAALVGAAAAVSAPAPLDSIHIRITADDISPLDYGFTGNLSDVSLTDLPPGENRLVVAELYQKGRLLYVGKAVTAFAREVPAEIALRCEAQFSRVTARFHLPTGLPAPVADGSLKLASDSGQFAAKLSIKDEFGSFALDQVPGDIRYDVTLSLTDGSGKVEYAADRSGVFLALGEEAHWDLPLLPGQAGADLAITLDTVKEAQLKVFFPARKRRPLRNGELILSEFNAAPSTQDSAGQGEWWEIFNRSADSLSLAGCRLSKDRSGGVTRSYAFDSAQVLGPGQARVYGRSAAKANVHYDDFVLVNTSATLFLLCAGDSVAVDSLWYSFSTADSGAVQAKEGFATSLNADNMSHRDSPMSWCETKTGGNGRGFASPGSVQSCTD